MPLPTQTDRELADELLRRSRPWTQGDYEHLRQAVLAMKKTHASWHLSDGSIRPSFDGELYWDLLGSLDRTHMRRDDD